MEFTSAVFIIAFPISLLVYHLIPVSVRRYWLLIVSLLFVTLAAPGALVCLFGITLISWLGGLFLSDKGKRKRLWLAFWIALIVIGLLGIRVINVRFGTLQQVSSLLVPLGLSFYSLQGIGYLADVYKDECECEKNPAMFMLYMSFFPRFLSGPIEKSGPFLKQINNLPFRVTAEDVKKGILLMTWGYFEKIVIADHAARIVNDIFEHYEEYSGLTLMKGAATYGIQLYADFDGYTHIALGAALLLGIGLTSNFRQPYFSLSVAQFWRRWHISLSSWLKDYVYIPLGGSRCGKIRNYFNLIVTFAVSGLWHGYGLKYLFWGLLHGIYQVCGKVTLGAREKLSMKLRVNRECASFKLLRMALTFVWVDLAWIIFRAESLRKGLGYIKCMFLNFRVYQLGVSTLYNIETLDKRIINLFLIGLVILLAVDILHETGKSIIAMLDKQNLLFRWMIYIGAVTFIIIGFAQIYGLDAGGFVYGAF